MMRMAKIFMNHAAAATVVVVTSSYESENELVELV